MKPLQWVFFPFCYKPLSDWKLGMLTASYHRCMCVYVRARAYVCTCMMHVCVCMCVCVCMRPLSE